MKEIKHTGDFAFTVIYEWDDDFNVRVKVFEITARTGDTDKPLYLLKDWESSEDNTQNTDEAEVFAEGYVNWEGHGNWEFSGVHLCGKELFDNFTNCQIASRKQHFVNCSNSIQSFQNSILTHCQHSIFNCCGFNFRCWPSGNCQIFNFVVHY